ncbi:MAG: amino acid adenylation domain-containing protein, partial [Kiritimatiellales bacterium]|nr:amino acid adenylation domain-containing protein [Kiritimatiellales bacterium]
MGLPVDKPLFADLDVFDGEAAKLAKWGLAPEAAFDFDTTVVHLFELQAKRVPDAIAVTDSINSLTYSELNHKANGLAACLFEKGVKADVPVGLSMKRSLEMAVGLLGILKAGGAYVPLDPDYPRERLDFIIADTAMPVIVTQSSLKENLSDSSAELICADELDETLPEFTGKEPLPSALAYIIYTSGSTGKPKGVMVEHRNLANYSLASVQQYGITQNDRMLQFSSINFDPSVEEIFSTWVSGATLVLRTEMIAYSISLFEQFIKQQRISIVDLPTAYWHEWMHGAQKLPESVRAVIIGGEKASMEAFKKWQALSGGNVRWFNTYGPTECTVASTLFEPGENIDEYSEVPLGRPIANTALFVVDDEMQLVAPGAEGELLIGGAGVARGYLNRDSLTAERFVKNPWGAGRLYRTGDLVRWLPDGNLDFIGRTDFQVKIRGFRIEPDEVASVLERHAAVDSAVVVARDDIAEQKALAAYVICNQTVSHAELVDFLKAGLPEYMIPTAFQTLEKFPMTPGGKVDRRALPKPDGETAAKKADAEAARSGLEQTIASIWCDVLGVEQVGLHDNFFELGGYSLLIIRILARLKGEGIDVAAPQLLQYQTVAELASQLGGETETGPGAPGIELERTDAETEFPLSHVEQRFWLTAQMGSVSPMIIPLVLRVSGELDVELLQRCMNELAMRQDMLRSSYRLSGDEAVRVVAESGGISLAVKDVRGDAAEQERCIRTDAWKPFDFETGPLWRMQVLRTGDAEYVIQMTAHHIIFDGWAVTVFIHELQTLYEALGAGKKSPLPDLKIRYGDYAAWQQKMLAATEMEEHSNYWKQKLENFQTLEFPYDYPRPAETTYNGGLHHFEVPAVLAKRLNELGRKTDATLFMTMLAAFKLLLSRYCGQDDILIGIPVALRPTAETEEIIGLFLNTVVLRTDLSGSVSFRELIGRVKQTALEAFVHQDMPFDRLVDLLKIPRDVSMSPLYQVIFSMNNYPAPRMKLGAMDLTEESVDVGMTDVDLGISIDADEQGLRGTIDFNTDLFDAATIKRLADHFLNVLAAVCNDPSTRIADVSLLSPSERSRILEEWNNTSTDYPRDTCTHRLVEEQVEKAPGKTAIVFGDTEVTYAQMNARANRLAHLLIEKGVKADDRVCVCLERGPELVIVELAIWKAGGAYVPLDPIYPSERIAYMIADSGSSLLITESSVSSVTSHASLVTLDDVDLSSYPETNPVVDVSSNNLAYLIYTSGSTGKPKGVAVEHRAFVNFLLAMQQTLRLTPEDTILAITTPCFDIAGLELHLAAVSGARVSILTREEALDGRRLAEQIEKNGTVLQATPATWRLLLESGWCGAEHLKMICGGEYWSRELADALLQGGGELWNMYGPTEAAVTASAEQVFAGGEGPIPIGRPIANVSLYILDKNRRPLPVGVPGELWVGGAGLARGYHHLDELTAEMFVSDPFSKVADARMYRTGDLAKWLPDGRVECLGRVDSQVKVRGFRIELEEIEKNMELHPAVKQAVASVYQAADGTNRLAGYFQCLENRQVELSSLRNLLKKNLPDYMIPSAFVALERIPLTPSGKTDRKALPEPGIGALAASTEYVAPRNALERVLASAWSEVLNRDEVGIHDNFFELGGHSLLLVQVMNKAAAAGVELSIQQIFRHQTIAELAVAIGGEAFQPLEETAEEVPIIGRIAEETRFP